MVLDMGYWGKVLKRILVVSLTVVGMFLAFKLAIFYMPFLIAFIISLLLEPIIRALMKKTKLSRKASAIIVLIITFVLIVSLLIWGITSLISEATNILQGLNGYFETAYSFINSIISNMDFSKIQISDEVANIIQSSALDFLNTLSTWLKNIITSVLTGLSSVPTVAIYVVITLLSLYFICTDKIYILDQIEHHMPKMWVRKIGTHLRDIIKSLGNYLKAQAILILVSFFISLIGFYLFYFAKLNIHYPLSIALGIGFVDALPILGSGIIMVPWAVISALTGDLTLGISILILWIVMSVVKQLVEPKIVSSQLGIHPIFTIIAMYTGFKLIGILGMFVGPIILIIFKNVFATLIDKGVLKTLFDRK